MQKIIGYLAFSVVLISLSGYGLAGENTTLNVFYSKPMREQIETFPTYSFDEQYAIYIYGNQVRHPPAIYLARPFASEGKKVIDQLTIKLGQAHDDLTIRDLVTVFSEMNRQKAYDVSSNEQLMRLLSDTVDRMKNSSWKSISAKEVQSIRASKSGQ